MRMKLGLTSLAVAGALAFAAPVAADPPKNGHGSGKGSKFDHVDKDRLDADRGPGHRGKSKHAKSEWRSDDDGNDRRHKLGDKAKKHKYRTAAYKPGGGPPPWAPAWGYRRKQAQYGSFGEPVSYPAPHPGYDPNSYYPPFAIGAGRCDRGALSSTIGKSVGAASGDFMKAHGADGDVASLAGLVIGAVVSDKLARRMDRIDQACIGQILEHAPDGRSITWASAGGPHYEVAPLATYTTGATYCREYQTTTVIGGRIHRERGLACRQPNGGWTVG